MPDNREKNLLVSILQNLDIAAFSWRKEGLFSALYPLPEWFTDFYPQKASVDVAYMAEYDLADAFPFIENFLYDAEKLWQTSANHPLRSGLWTEVDNQKTEFHLEAVALKVESTCILLILNETSNFSVRHQVFQNARNLALENEKLESAIHLHQRELQQQLEAYYQDSESYQKLNQNIENESAAVLICQQDGTIEIYNKALIDIYPVSNNSELHTQSLLEKWVTEAENQYPEIHRAMEIGKHWEGEFESFDTSNNKKWVRLLISPVFDSENNLAHYICIANDISDFKLSHIEIERASQIDSNTQLPNRRNFWNFLSQQFSLRQSDGKGLALFYIDIDHFKHVNDDLGPKQADFVLSTVASRLKRCLKKHDFIAHLGGDEFAVIITDFSDQQSLAAIAQRLKDNIYRDISFGDFTLNTSVSIGIAIYPQHGLKPRLLVKNADYAMYHAKEMGRNQFQFSSPYSKRRIKRTIHIEQGLKSALANNEFELLYQPQVSLGSGFSHRIEALIRWHHPKHGLITPADFISIAEETGIIIEIGRWVLDTACSQIQRLKSAGFQSKISVNVSPKQFKYSNLTKDVEKSLAQFNIDPAELELEVTESIFLEDIDNVTAQLNILRNLGISISLDDFGTGYSSLTYLKHMPVNVLKIDRSFIQELPANQHSRAIVQSIIAMAHQLSIEVVAEGVENQQQYDFLHELNCDFVQGYLFYKPLSSDDLLALYHSLSPVAH